MVHVIVWDLETVPDLKGFAAANGLGGKSDDEIRAKLGDKFPKHIYHSIICIGALVAHRENSGHWIVDALGAPPVGERPEKELIASFVDKIAALTPQLVTFNGCSFDLPVLRYRAMVHCVAAPGLAARPYFHRYTEDAVDLCDVLSSFSSQARNTARAMCSTPTGCGSAMSYFAGGCRTPSFRAARPTLWSSLRRGATRGRTCLM
jgi:predicted PolB exonuclease-like 3'-5' exonuclease